MQLFNTTTDQIVFLSITDKNRIDWFADFAQLSHNPDINYNKNEERYEINQVNYDFWAGLTAQYQNMYDLIDELKAENDDIRHEMENVIENYRDTDFKDTPSYVIPELEEIKAKI